jgi:hypothetical protein
MNQTKEHKNYEFKPLHFRALNPEIVKVSPNKVIPVFNRARHSFAVNSRSLFALFRSKYMENSSSPVPVEIQEHHMKELMWQVDNAVWQVTGTRYGQCIFRSALVALILRKNGIWARLSVGACEVDYLDKQTNTLKTQYFMGDVDRHVSADFMPEDDNLDFHAVVRIKGELIDPTAVLYDPELINYRADAVTASNWVGPFRFRELTRLTRLVQENFRFDSDNIENLNEGFKMITWKIS